MNEYGVIFDMDGVLVDSYQAHYESWRQAALRYGLVLAEPDFARTFGRTSREIIGQLWPGRFDEAEIAAFDSRKEAAYRVILDTHFPEMPGAGDLLGTLHAAGFRLAIGSSGPPENVALAQRRLPNGKLIAATVTGKEVRHGKPDPEVFVLAAQKLGLAPGKCAVVEDALVGLQAARRAGAVAIGLVGTATRDVLAPYADLVVDRLRDITPTVVARLMPTPRA